MRYSELGRYFSDGRPAQEPADVAVVMATVVRPSLGRAIESVYAQDYRGRVQVMLGVDVLRGEARAVAPLIERRPGNVSFLFLTLPYSTSKPNGGVHGGDHPGDAGALRAILSYMANAPHVAYLDDDNEWLPHHLSSLHGAIIGRRWAFSQRMLVDEATDRDAAVDVWHSTGPGRGKLGGFVDPNCMMIDKVRLCPLLGYWCAPNPEDTEFSADRLMAYRLEKQPFGETGQPTVRYRLRSTNLLWDEIRATA